MGLSRTQSIIFYVIILLIGLGIAHFTIGNYALIGLLIMVILISVLTYLLFIPCCCKRDAIASEPKKDNKSTALISEQNVELTVEDNANKDGTTPDHEVKPEETPKKKRRLYYIDNLKAFLTVIVVIHHVTCTFVGNGWMIMFGKYHHSLLVPGNAFLAINQSYFMCLFFFISGYFTPISFDKKGRFLFMADKLKRLGVPFLVYTLCLGPLLDITIKYGFIDNGSSYTYGPNAGPCWFLGWLLIFNAMYLVMDDSVPIYIAQMPSFLKLLLIGLGLGVVQLIVVMIVPGGFIFMPITLGSLPFDILFFCGGVMAKRNEWLRGMSNNYNAKVIAVMMIVFMTFWLILDSVMYATDSGGNYSIWSKDLSTECDADDDGDDDDDDGYSASAIGIGVAFFVVSGLGTMIMSLGMMQFAEKYWNYKSDRSTFFSVHAYCVYLIHPWVLCPVAWTWRLLLEAMNGVELEFCVDSVTSLTHFGGHYLVYIGWLYTAILSLLIVWPLAWCIRKIPGMNKII